MNSAIFSKCGTYRYTLTRRISQPIRWVRPALFIMLNPSTADEIKDDPTIRRCISFAKREGCTGLTVVNLFALRATNPKELLKHEDPIGPENDKIIQDMLRLHRIGIVVAAWGAHPLAHERGKKVMKMFDGNILCLGTTKDGSPRHPLYVKSAQELVEIK